MDDAIVKKARRLVRCCGTTDPFRIAAEIGVKLHFSDLGAVKGMYTYLKRNRFVVVNSSLDEYLQRIVCAHELGHDQFHRALAKNKWLQEFMIYDMNQRPEYEANIFASEMLLPDDKILYLTDNGLDIEQIAKTMCSDVNLIALKLATLSQQGYRFRQIQYRSDFLKG